MTGFDLIALILACATAAALRATRPRTAIEAKCTGLSLLRRLP
jgi:hypothetical protein